MRTTLDLEAGRLHQAKKPTRLPTKQAEVEPGSRELSDTRRRGRFAAAAGAGYGMTLKEFLKSRRDEA